MSSLRLGTCALLPTDVALVRMLLRLYGFQGAFKWSYAEAPPYDAVLVEAAPLEADPPRETEWSTPHVLRLTRADAPGTADTLTRPLCSKKLRGWLEDVERSLAAAPVPVLAPSPVAAEVALPPAPDPTSVPEAEFVLPLTPEPLALPPADAPRFRLQRWPRQGILRDDPDRVRMATLLSRRALNAHDLVKLTGFAPHPCQIFMQILHASSLLQPAQPTAVAPSPEAASQAPKSAAHAPKPASTTKPRFTQGLILGLRKRLGL